MYSSHDKVQDSATTEKPGDLMITRRQLMLAAGAGALAMPFGVFAQPAGKVWRIGILSPQSGLSANFEAFLDQFRTLGYVEGRNLQIEYRWSAGRDERLPEMAADLVRLRVDAIVTHAGLPVAAAKAATSTIPIVTAATADPVGQGLVASLARPGGNVTGLSMLSSEIVSKRLQLLREIIPNLTRVAVLAQKGTPATPLLIEQLQLLTRRIGVTLSVHELNQASEFTGAFAAIQRERAQALIVQQNPFFRENSKQILEPALRHRLPSIFELRGFVDEGGLISYGPNVIDMFRRAAYYVDRILKGTKPADLPVEQPTKFEMVVNLKTAKALGITIPQTVLLQADEVIK
ncbi:MAG: ABC transporter substrate-binding protein [Burkholderiales bacterium]